MKSKLDTENDQITQATAIGLSAILGTQSNQVGAGIFEKLKQPAKKPLTKKEEF